MGRRFQVGVQRRAFWPLAPSNEPSLISALLCHLWFPRLSSSRLFSHVQIKNLSNSVLTLSWALLSLGLGPLVRLSTPGSTHICCALTTVSLDIYGFVAEPKYLTQNLTREEFALVYSSRWGRRGNSSRRRQVGDVIVVVVVRKRDRAINLNKSQGPALGTNFLQRGSAPNRLHNLPRQHHQLGTKRCETCEPVGSVHIQSTVVHA